jgi:type IV pilus assembly protein PilC
MAERTINRDPDQLGTFTYEAISKNGERIKGPKAKMSAYSAAEVRTELTDQGYFPVWIKEVSSGSRLSLNTEVKRRGLHLKALQVSNFARALFQLISAGISMSRALEAIALDTSIPNLPETCNDMASKISNGAGIADTFAEHPHAFDAVFCGYLAAGEITGNLGASLSRLTVLAEKRAQMRAKIKGVTAYPLIVSCVITVLISLIILFLVPKYQSIYGLFHSKLPAPTLLLLNFSKHFLPIHILHIGGIPLIGPDFEAPLLYVLLIIVGVWYFLRTHKEDPKVSVIVDKIRFHTPISGKLIHKLVLYRWASTLAGALGSNVQTTEALALSATASGSRWMRIITTELIEGINAGLPLSEMMLRYTEIFPADLRTMVATGEASGETPTMLEASSRALSDEIDSIVAGLSAKIEVALLMFMGITVGSMLIALYLPILNLASTIQGAY